MADATPLIDSWIDNAENTKQGRKFFGCCCDSRRAVIVVNTLDIILCVACYISFASQAEFTGMQISVWVVNQIWNVTLILGAVYYSDIIAIMGVMWQLFKLMSDIYIFVAYHQEGVVTSVVYISFAIPLIICTIYANSLFAYEVRNDIMSKATYKRRERYSCCCA